MRHPRHPHHHDSPFGGRHWEKAWFAGPPWGGGRRARRGDVRTALLSLLADNPMHGYDLIRELEQRSGGAWRPSPGSIYPTLQLLEDEGLITSEESGGRRRFTLTDAGRAEAGQAEAPPWEHIGDETVENWNDIRDASFGAMNALRQVMMTGNDEQRRRAVEVIAEAKRKLYAILAE